MSRIGGLGGLFGNLELPATNAAAVRLCTCLWKRRVNLPLHFGFLGALEAGLIALLVGLLGYGVLRWVVRKLQGSVGHALGWGFVVAALVSAGIDAWNLFYLGMVRLESPVYARLALQGIHDADSLGTRVVCEIIGAGLGVLLGWQLFSGGLGKQNITKSD
jgi:hypothetical protein